MALYDQIGSGYFKSRPADPRIVDALVEALDLPESSRILDIGAGTGKYARALADRGYEVLAIEPSEVMRNQATPHPRVRFVVSSAEEIQLPSTSADGAFLVLALHHFKDRAKAFEEILRVIGHGPLVIFTFEPSRIRDFWLVEYFPGMGAESHTSFYKLPKVADEVASLTSRKTETIPFPLPRDLVDRFASACWGNPEGYLGKEIRNGISSFQLLPADEVEAGVERLRRDLETGIWDGRYGYLRSQEVYDAGYHLIRCLE